MYNVVPHQLWVGHAGDGRNLAQALDSGIAALVQMALEEPPLQPPRDLLYLRFPLVDGGGNSLALRKLTILTVANLVENRLPTLICCGAGMSRSPAVAAAALSLVRHQPPEQCLGEIISQCRADVSPQLWAEIVPALSSLTDNATSL